MPSDGDRAKALLTYANYAKVAAALLVSRAAVADWAKGNSVTPYRLRQLEQLLRPDLQIEEAPSPSGEPAWARAVAQEAAEDVVRRLVPPEMLGAAHRLLAQLANTPPPSDEAEREEHEAQDQVV